MTSEGWLLLTIRGICFCVLLLALNISTHIPEQTGEVSRFYQVGAWGDNASTGNLGVRAEIRTNAYPIPAGSNHSDAFWVGTDLANEAFIQFGYEILPGGQSCSSDDPDAHLTSQGCVIVHLFWQYWPNITGAVFVTGIIHLVRPTTFDVNGTWHSYEIASGRLGDAWFFKLDGQLVSKATFTPVRSKSAIYVAAEQGTIDPPSRLGPVEFRNMSYLKNDVWHQVESLVALVSCFTMPGFKQCHTSNPYGVSVIGPNDIIAGVGIEKQQDGRILWPTPAPLTPINFLKAAFDSERQNPPATLVSRIFLISIFGVLALAAIRLRRRRARSSTRSTVFKRGIS